MPAGPAGATVDVWGQDASVLMGLEEKVREWSGMTDSAVANQIFASYDSVTPAPDNTRDDTPVHSEDEHTLMQRGSDIAFLRRLARRTGRWCRIICAGTPGQRVGLLRPAQPHRRPGRHHRPERPGQGQHDGPRLQLGRRPADQRVGPAGQPYRRRPGRGQRGHCRLRAAPAGRAGDSATSPAGRPNVILTAAADTAELPGRARSVLREAGWFARCEGTADLAVLKQVLRVGVGGRRGRGRISAVGALPGVERPPHHHHPEPHDGVRAGPQRGRPGARPAGEPASLG